MLANGIISTAALVALFATPSASSDTDNNVILDDGDLRKLTGNDDSPEIIGGTVLERDIYPFLISIGTEGGTQPGVRSGHNCGATLIAPNAVLTAAHCLTAIPDDVYNPVGWVDINRYNLESGLADVERIRFCQNEFGARCDENQAYGIRHPDYDPPTFNNDIAVIILPESLRITDIDPVALNEDPDFPTDGELEAIGWGLTERFPDRRPSLPWTAMIAYLANDDCSSPPYEVANINESTLCVIDENKSICFGDSGGPALAQTACGPVQVGVSSFVTAPTCLFPDRPNVFARVSTGLDWIRSTVCDETGDQLCGPAPPSCSKSSKSSKGSKVAKASKGSKTLKVTKAAKAANLGEAI